jgi:hypothetical protein
MSLSDLELVAKAMEPTNRAATEEQSAEEAAQAKALSAKSNLQQEPGRLSLRPACQEAGTIQRLMRPARNGHLQPRTDSHAKPGSAPQTSSQTQGKTNGDTPKDITVPGIDPELLASLSPADLATLQPLITALTLGDDIEGEDDLDELDENDPRIQELLRQMDVAGDVADDLEGKLDKLIAELGQEEVQMEQAVEAVKPAIDGKEKAGP